LRWTGRSLRQGLTGASAQEIDRQRQHQGKPRERPDLDEEGGRVAACLGGLGGDDQDLAHDRDQPDEQERLDQDPAAEVDDPQRVEQLRDDEQEQHAVEQEHAGIADRTRARSLDQVRDGADESEGRADGEQDRDDDIDRALDPADPFVQGRRTPRSLVTGTLLEHR
jgi:hypothetical protein